MPRPAPEPAAVRWLRRWAWPLLAVYWIAMAVATHWPKLDLTGDGPPGIFQLDKIAHLLGYAGLTGLLILARPLGRRTSLRLNALAAALIAAGYALLDEYSQGWIPALERTASWADLVADFIAILSVYLVVTARAPRSLWRTGPMVLCRIIWLLTAPTLALLTIMPSGNAIIGQWYRALGLSRGQADKFSHFVLGMTLTWLLALAAPGGRERPRLGAAITVLVMGLSAPIIEVLQRTTGRGYEVADVQAHAHGFVIGLAVWALFGAVYDLAAMLRPAAAPPAAGHDTPAARPAPAATTRFVGHALLVSALTLLSRLTGLVRDAVLAAVFGLGAVSDAFFIGFLVPNLFRRLFGEGALTAAFIPHYADLLKQDPTLARRFASLCLVLLAVVLAVITIIGELVLAAMHTADWSDSTLLALRLTMIMLPYMPLICLVALLGGILQVHGRFGPPAAAPVMLNLVMIAVTLGAAVQLGDHELPRIAMISAVGVVVAGVLQLGWQLLALRGTTGLTLHFAGTGASLRAMLVMMLPMLVGLAVFQINAFLDSLIAFALSPRGEATHLNWLGQPVAYPIEVGAVAALQWAQRLYQFPLGVFGIAVATAIFPALSHAASDVADDAGERFRTILRHGLRLTVFIGLPASVGLILLRLPLTRVIYERGAFSADDAERVAAILAGYAASVWAYSMTHVLTRAFYARKDARTPLRISMALVVVNLALNLMLIWRLGAAGLAWSTAISGAMQVVCLLVAVRRHVPRPIDATVLRSWVRTATLTAVMAGALVPMLVMWDVATLDTLESALLLAAGVTTGVLIILGGAWLMGASEVQWLVRRRTG